MTESGTCSACGASAVELGYSPDGEFICSACSQLGEVDALEKRAAMAMFAASGSALGLGLVSAFFNPMCAFSMLGVASALGTIVQIARHPEYARHMGWRKPVALTLATLGLVLSATGMFLSRILLALAL